MRWVKAALCCAGILIGLTGGNAAECPNNRNDVGTRRVISIDPTKHARRGCMHMYQSPAVRRQSQRISRATDARLASLRVAWTDRSVRKGGGTYRVGNPYVIAGRTYTPQKDPNYRAEGEASWYGEEFHGRLTANGEIFDVHALTAAHPTLPLPSYVRVTNLGNDQSLVVRLNDRGPYHGHRLIDVSVRVAKLLGFYDRGLAQVRVEYLARAELEGSDDDALAATLRHEDPLAAQAAVTVPIQQEIANLSQVDRGSMLTQCGSLRATRTNPLLVSFNGDRVDNVNCKLAIVETKVAVSWPATFRQTSYCVADHARLDAVPF